MTSQHSAIYASAWVLFCYSAGVVHAATPVNGAVPPGIRADNTVSVKAPAAPSMAPKISGFEITSSKKPGDPYVVKLIGQGKCHYHVDYGDGSGEDRNEMLPVTLAHGYSMGTYSTKTFSLAAKGFAGECGNPSAGSAIGAVTVIAVATTLATPVVQAATNQPSVAPENMAGTPKPILAVKTKVQLESLSVIAALGDKAHFRAKVTHPTGKPVSGAEVEFYVTVGGKSSGVGSGKTDDNGMAEDFVQKPLVHLMPGTFDVTAKVTGKSFNPTEAGFSPIEAKSNLTILKSKVQLEIKHYVEGKKVKVHVRMSRMTDNDGINGRTLNFTLYGKTTNIVATTSNLTTDANGGLLITLDPGAVDVSKGYSVKVAFEGDEFYFAGSDIAKGYAALNANVKVTVASSASQMSPGQMIVFDALVQNMDVNPPAPINGANLTLALWAYTNPVCSKSGCPHTNFPIGYGTTDVTGKAKITYHFTQEQTIHFPVAGSYPLDVFVDPKPVAYEPFSNAPGATAFSGGFNGQISVVP